tara:strand:+ start:60 stop:512 length:453 start_codon:yes stop_codon:yes gene_type:complete
VRRGDTVESSDGSPNSVENRPHLFFGGRSIVEDFDEGSPSKVLNDELSAFVIKVPYGWYGKTRFSSSNQQPCLTDHSTNAKPMVEVWVAPRPRASLFSDSWSSEPLPLPNFSLSAEVQALVGVEDHASLTKAFFLNVHAYPFLQKGLSIG